jgi:hypothetical protein
MCTWRKKNMARERTGYVYKDKRNKRWITRVTFIGNDGKRKSIKKSADSKPEARKLLKDMILKLESKGEEGIKAENFYSAIWLRDIPI